MANANERAAVVGSSRDTVTVAAQGVSYALVLDLCVFASPCSPDVCSCRGVRQPKNVLVLYSFTDRRARKSWRIKVHNPIPHGAPVDFLIEYLETQRFESPGTKWP